MHRVFKPARKGDRLRCAYLNPDGHVIVTFERYELGSHLQYVKLAQSIGVRCQFYNGRIVFHHAAQLAAIASLPKASVSVYLDNYSNLSREKGVRVDSLEVNSEAGYFTIHTSDVIGGELSIQVSKVNPEEAGKVDTTETWGQVRAGREWSDMHVVERYENEPAASEAGDRPGLQ